MFYDKYLVNVNSWHEGGVASVTVDIAGVEWGSIAFVEGTNVLDKILEPSLFCISDIVVM